MAHKKFDSRGWRKPCSAEGLALVQPWRVLAAWKKHCAARLRCVGTRGSVIWAPCLKGGLCLNAVLHKFWVVLLDSNRADISWIFYRKRTTHSNLDRSLTIFWPEKKKKFKLNHRLLENFYCQLIARDLRVVECLVPFSANFFQILGPAVSTWK